MSFLKALSPAAMVASNPGKALDIAGSSGLFPGLSLGKALFGGHHDAPAPSAAATGLGHVIGADPTRISSIASNIGQGMNGIAAAGGASPGYSAPEAPSVDNHMQLLDPGTIQQLIQQFGGRSQMGHVQ